jgi:hypothetical protein
MYITVSLCFSKSVGNEDTGGLASLGDLHSSENLPFSWAKSKKAWELAHGGKSLLVHLDG